MFSGTLNKSHNVKFIFCIMLFSLSLPLSGCSIDRVADAIVEVYSAVVPLFLILCIGVVVITYIPWLSTYLPGLLL